MGRSPRLEGGGTHSGVRAGGASPVGGMGGGGAETRVGEVRLGDFEVLGMVLARERAVISERVWLSAIVVLIGERYTTGQIGEGNGIIVRRPCRSTLLRLD